MAQQNAPNFEDDEGSDDSTQLKASAGYEASPQRVRGPQTARRGRPCRRGAGNGRGAAAAAGRSGRYAPYSPARGATRATVHATAAAQRSTSVGSSPAADDGEDVGREPSPPPQPGQWSHQAAGSSRPCERPMVYGPRDDAWPRPWAELLGPPEAGVEPSPSAAAGAAPAAAAVPALATPAGWSLAGDWAITTNDTSYSDSRGPFIWSLWSDGSGTSFAAFDVGSLTGLIQLHRPLPDVLPPHRNTVRCVWRSHMAAQESVEQELQLDDGHQTAELTFKQQEGGFMLLEGVLRGGPYCGSEGLRFIGSRVRDRPTGANARGIWEDYNLEQAMGCRGTLAPASPMLP